MASPSPHQPAPDLARSDPTSTRSVASLLRRFIRPERRRFGLGLAVLAVEASTGVLQVWPLAYLIDYLNGHEQDLLTSLGGDWSARTVTIFVLTFAMVTMAALSSATDSWAEILLARAGRGLGFAMRTDLYDHLQSMSLAAHDQLRTGDTITRVTGDVEEVEDFVIDSLSDIFGSVFTLVGTVLFLFFLSWQVAVVAVLVIPILAFVSDRFSVRIKAAAKTEKRSQGELASVAQEVLTSMRVIQTYGRRDYEVARFGLASLRAADAALAAAKLQAFFSLVVKVMEAVTIAAVVWLGVWLVDRQVITLGLIVLFVIQIQNMFKPTRKIIKEWNKIGRLLASAGRINELFQRQATITDRPDAVDAGRVDGRIEFSGVDFAYRLEDEDARHLPAGHTAERQVLRGVDLTIEPGEIVAVVGQTGAGKSTIAQLLPRLYDPSAGSVRIDGNDIRNFTLDSLRDNIGMVHQDTLLFSGSVYDNIAYGREGATAEAVEQAAREAYAHDFIVDLPDGYLTLLGERGLGLSGGQRQRIAIARCLVRDCPILILDEPTTGLDGRAVEEVLGALERLIEGRTTLIISHDLQLVARADRAIVIENGEIVEAGTHRELMAANGQYAELWAAQLDPDGVDGSTSPGSSRAMMLQRYPEIDRVLDEASMRDRLARTLVDTDNYHLESVTVEKDSYDSDNECYRFRYRCRLLDLQDRRARYDLLLARFFGNPVDRRRFRAEVVDPLLDDLGTPPDGGPFTSSIWESNDLNLIVTAFPFDVELPTLRSAVDPDHVAGMLTGALGRAVEPTELTIDVAHYGRRDRCALRYGLGATNYFGKLRADTDPRHARRVLTDLGRQLRSGSWPGLLLPELVTTDVEGGLVVMSEVPGQAVLKKQILAVGLNPERGAKVIADVGRVAAFLHSSYLDSMPMQSLDDELDELSDAVSLVRRGMPKFGLKLQSRLELLAVCAEEIPSVPLRLTHGDFTPSQFLVGEDSLGLVDFDTLCVAEPARDLGQFLAYCRLALTRQVDVDPIECDGYVDRIREWLVAGYVSAIDEPLGQLLPERADRIALYEAVSLFRMVGHSWQKNKTTRLEVGLGLLDRVLAGLQQPTETVDGAEGSETDDRVATSAD